jgi:hypothetical protein
MIPDQSNGQSFQTTQAAIPPDEPIALTISTARIRLASWFL